MTDNNDIIFLERAVDVARHNMECGGGPFGAVIVEHNEIIAESGNAVRLINDPTAHAEIQAIRLACCKKQTFSLENCTIYTTCEPCPMCLGAIYWARISRIVFGATRFDAQRGGFDDNRIYSEITKDIQQREVSTTHLPHPQARELFTAWLHNDGRLRY